MADQPQTISGEKLTVLTGCTDRWHRQLAQRGFFPKPENGDYKLVPTLQGLFRFYRESRERATGDLAAEKLTKMRTERMIAELKLETQRGHTVQLDEVKGYHANLAAKWDQLIRMKLEVEAPMLLQGKSIVEMRVVLKRLVSEIRGISNEGLDEWTPPTL